MRWFRHHRCDPCHPAHPGRYPAAAPQDHPASPGRPPGPRVTAVAGTTAVRRNVALRAGDRMFRIGQLVVFGTDEEIAADGRAHLAVLYRTVRRVLEVHGNDLDGGCAGCGHGRGRLRRSANCPTRRAVLRVLSEEDGDDR